MSNLEQQCTNKGLKMTGQRRTILKVLEDSEDHPSVEEVYERSKAIDDSISTATVYRTMGLLDEIGLVVRHEFKENFARYELNTDHHDHLIDVESGEIIEFHNDAMEKIQEKIAAELGYELVDHRMELYARKIKKK